MKPTIVSLARRCDGVSRRDFLHLGLLTTFGLSVADLFRLQALGTDKPDSRFARATSCILFFLYGGPSHRDPLDPKPDGPC